MLRPTAVKVTPLDDYMLSIVFDNNKVKFMDIKPYIKGEWYGQLRDEDYFKTVHTNGYSIE